MDFELTDEQKLIQDTVRAFVDERVLPVAIENDIEHKLDLELIEGMAELGILGIVIPEEYLYDDEPEIKPANGAPSRRRGKSSPSRETTSSVA